MKIFTNCRLLQYAFILVFELLNAFPVSAQPAVLGTQLVNGSYVTYNLTDLGAFRQHRLQAASSGAISTRNWEFAQGTAASPDYTTNWRPNTSNNTLSSNIFIPTSFDNGARYNTSSMGASGLLPAITSGNYYTFNVTENAAANNVMQLLETSFNPVTISTVSQSPAGSFVNSGIAPVITANTSATPASGENLFIRWSTDISFTNSTIVAMSGSGTTYTGTIPAQGAGNSVYYYVLSSNKTESELNTDKTTHGEQAIDMGTLNFKTLVQNGSGNTNYSYTSTSNPVVVNSSGGTASASYATLQAGFSAINSGTHTGTIAILIEGNTTETGSASLNASGSGSASYSSINVQPFGGARTISGSISGSGIIHLNGADNVTIDGLNSGGNTLIITNSLNTNASATSTIRFTNDAENNSIQNCTITGSTIASSGGLILFGDGNVFGNNNNTIASNTISAEGSNLPLFGIYSNEGVSPGNSDNSVLNNNISDVFSATSSSVAIYLNAANSAWTISGNRIFQTGIRTATSGAIQRAIYIVSGTGYTISNNIIGYANSNGTSTTTYTSAAALRYTGIEISVGTSTASSISGNTIAGISLTTSSSQNSGSGIFSGIYVNTGLVNVTNNTIGIISTGGISFSSTAGTTGIIVNGIGIVTTAGLTTTISSNSISGFSTAGSTAGSGYNFSGINTSGAGNFTITGNTTGSTSTPNAITIGISGITTGTTNIRCIDNSATGTVVIGGSGSNANIIANVSLTTATSASGSITGIRNNTSSTSTSFDITGNIIHTLSANNNFGVLTGISTNNGGPTNIIRNKIYGLNGSGTSNTVDGINTAGGVGTTINITNNLVGNLTAPFSSSTVPSAVQGINISSTGSIPVNVYYNTVYLAATSTGANFGSVAIYANTNPTVTLRNNIFVNNSTPNGTGRTVAYQRSSTTLTTYNTASNNNLYYAGTPSATRVVFFDGTNSDQALSAMHTRITTGNLPRDLNSITENPDFLSTVGSDPDFLKIDPATLTQIEGRGTTISGITDDYAGDVRNITTPDIGADEFTGISNCLITVTSASGSASPSTCYGSMAAAILAINQTASPYHGGTIICTVQDGYTETAPTAGYSITREGTAGNTITFTKSGSGANPVFTAATTHTVGSIMDAVFKLVGADYVTIEKFTIQENSANTTTASGSNNMTEFGIGIFYSTTTNGAQNNTIQNNTITLNRTYSNTFGIYSTTRHSASSGAAADISASTGANSNNKVYGNSISNVNNGIAFGAVNAAANMDVNNDIGGSSSATGNTLSNWGGQVAAGSYSGLTGTNFGIWMNHQPGGNIAYNTISSATGVNVTGSIYGIRLDYSNGGASGTVSNTVSDNTITLNGAASSTFRCIDLGATSGTSVTYNITNNLLLNNVVTGSSTSFSGILSASAIHTLNISNNIIQGTTSAATSGGFTGISNTTTVSAAININNNQIGNAVGNAITFSAATSGSLTGINVAGGSGAPGINITGNNFQGFTQSAIGTGGHNYIFLNAFTSSNSHTITGNTFTNLDANTSGDVYFIQDASSMAASRIKNVSNNNISGSFIKRAGAGFSNVYFFSDGSAASASSSTATFSNNDFSNVTLNGNTFLGGWFTQDGTGIAKTIQNNVFRNIGGGTSSIEVMTVRGSGSATISGNTIRGINGGGTSVTGLILGSGTQTATANTIRNLSNSAGLVRAILSNSTGTNTIQGHTIDSIYTTASTSIAMAIDISAGTTINISKNKIYDIANTSTNMNATDGAVNGIRVSAGTTVNINNNLIGDLKATNASDASNVAVRGININASSGTTSTTNLYYNTIYLNTSGGANFSSTAVYQFASSTTASFNLDMRNNILVNLSTPSGTGLTTAFRRSSNTSLNNYSTNSNNNLFYAGTPSATRLIFTDGSTPQLTVDSYISFMSTRDNASVTENVPFLSTTVTNANFLHVDVTNPTVVESGGTTATISPTGDYDGDIRFGEAGYAGTGTAPDIGADEIVGINTASYWFRTKSSGTNWKSPTYWEYSPDGISWTAATSFPTSAATKINIRNGHTITIPSSVTANALQIDNGGTLNQTNGFNLTIANGSGNDGSGYDFIVENGGIYVINGTRPVFNIGATAEIRTGGLVRADGNSSPNESDDFAYQPDATYRTGSIFQWNNSNAFQTSGITYFQNSSTTDLPIFRVSASIGTNLGASSATTFNGKFECNSGTTTWANAGTKTFRDGIGGTSTITHNSSCGTFLISGTNAVIDGSVTLNIDNNTGVTPDLQIASGSTCTISGSPTINIGAASFAGSLFTVDGTLNHNGSVPINFQTGLSDFTVNGNYSGTGTLTLSSASTDLIIGGTSGGSAGTFRFTSGSSNNTASSLNITRTGSSANMTLGSDFGVTNTMTIGTGATLTIGSNTLTGNGTVAGTGSLTGSTTSNLTIGGTGGGSFGTLLFTPGAQTLNNFTMGRSGSTPAVTLGASNNLTVGGVFDITNSATTVVVGSNTLTMNGTLTGAGSFTGSSTSNMIVGGSAGGSLGTMRFATGAQTLNNLTISRTGSGANAVLGSNLTINNVLDITSSAASLSIASNTLTLAGTITGSGALSGTSSSNLTMTGSGQVGTLRFATGGQLLNTISIDRSGTTNNYAALMASPLTVNTMTLTNGIIATGANLFTWTRTGSLLPATQTSYTSNSTTYKNSYLCLCDGSGNALSFTTPFDAADNIGFRAQNVGNNVWLPVGVDFNAPNRMWIDNSGPGPLGTADDITVLIGKGDIGGTDKPVVRRIWYAYEGTSGGTSANMRLYFTKQDPSLFGISQDEVETGFAYLSDIHLAQKNYNDPNYIDVAQGTDILTATANTIGTEIFGQYTIGISPDVNTLADGINQFSRFTVMNISSFILPVTITKVNATLQPDASVKISWTSVQETNIDHYEIQRSKDAAGFEYIGRMMARNSGALEQLYQLTDFKPLPGNNFYRIKIVEKDGKVSYSNVVLVVNGSITAVIKIQPNLISGSHTGIQFTNAPAGKFELTLYSLSGQRLWKQGLQHGGGSAYYNLWLPANLSNATYLMQITNADGVTFAQKIVVQQ